MDELYDGKVIEFNGKEFQAIYNEFEKPCEECALYKELKGKPCPIDCDIYIFREEIY